MSDHDHEPNPYQSPQHASDIASAQAIGPPRKRAPFLVQMFASVVAGIAATPVLLLGGVCVRFAESLGTVAISLAIFLTLLASLTTAWIVRYGIENRWR